MFVTYATISNLVIITVTTMVFSNLPCQQGRQKRVLFPVEKVVLGLQQGADGLKIFTPNRKHLLSIAE
jgi:hypothetical protein